jgi:hypothetical protein
MTTSSVVPGGNTEPFSMEQVSAMASRSKDKDFANRVISWTKSAHLRCRTIRQQIERQWYLNLAFYAGNQRFWGWRSSLHSSRSLLSCSACY